MSGDGGPLVLAHFDATKISGQGAWEQKRRLARAMRLVIERLVPSNAPEDELRRAADGLERYAESANAGDVGAFFDQSPMIGLANPLAPPITIGRSGPLTAIASVTFGAAYEGPPGCVHGGFVAAAFDEVLGYVQSLGGNPGMTARLTVHYRRPTPLHTELIFESELVRTEGRKIFCTGKVRANGELTAEAEGLFISVDRSHFQALLEQRERREQSRDEGG